MKISREQKQQIAAVLLDCAGTRIEFWDEICENSGETDLVGMGEIASELFGKWLDKLPGDNWDMRIKNEKASF